MEAFASIRGMIQHDSAAELEVAVLIDPVDVHENNPLVGESCADLIP
jgi:hypothetical protein